MRAETQGLDLALKNKPHRWLYHFAPKCFSVANVWGSRARKKMLRLRFAQGARVCLSAIRASPVSVAIVVVFSCFVVWCSDPTNFVVWPSRTDITLPTAPSVISASATSIKALNAVPPSTTHRITFPSIATASECDHPSMNKIAPLMVCIEYDALKCGHAGAIVLVNGCDEASGGDCISIDKVPLSTSQLSTILTQGWATYLDSLNLAHAHGIHRGFCELLEFHAGLTVISDLQASRAASLLPFRHEPGQRPVYIGVRARGPKHKVCTDKCKTLPKRASYAGKRSYSVVNPYLTLGPSTFLWPKGYPIQLVDEDQHGDSRNAPELIRLAARPEHIAVLHSVSDVHPEVDMHYKLHAARTGKPKEVRMKGNIPAVMLAPGTFSPYSSRSTLHRYSAFWSLYLPSSVSSSVRAVWRSYIAQAIFPMLDKTVGFTKPWVSGQDTEASTDIGSEQELYEVADPLLELLHQWRGSMSETCEGEPSKCHAGWLLQELYFHLYEQGVIGERDIIGVQAWLQVLVKMDYAFPPYVPVAMRTCVDLSPRLHGALDVHATVLTALADQWAFDTATWHAAFSGSYRHVTYFLEGSPGSSASLHVPLVYPGLSTVYPYIFPPQPHQVNGFTGYEAFLLGWKQNVDASAVLFQHDDSLLGASTLHDWLLLTASSCSLMAHSAALPHVSLWKNVQWWWMTRTDVQASGRALTKKSFSSDALRCHDRSPYVTAWHYAAAAADLWAVRRACPEAGTFVQALQQQLDVRMYLELAVPTAAVCAFPPSSRTSMERITEDDVLGYRLHNGSWYIEQFRAMRGRGYYHPIKLSKPQMIAAALFMRDEGWVLLNQRFHRFL